MNADVVIMDGMVLDAITSENKKLHKELAMAKGQWEAFAEKADQESAKKLEIYKKLEAKTAECVGLAKKVVDLTAWQEEADKLIWKMIKENNELRAQIDKQVEVEQSLWEKIWGLEFELEHCDDDYDEFN